MDKIKALRQIALATLLAATSSCMNFTMEDLEPSSNAKEISEMVAPTYFKWTTTQTVNVSIVGLQTTTPIQSTLTINGQKGSYYKGLQLASKSQNLKLVIPSNEKSLTFKFKSVEKTVQISEGNATIDLTQYASTLMAAPVHNATLLKSAQEADATDLDGDGVADNEDEYPADANRAYNNYFPAQGQNGTVAFEDNWPTKGDYDFNDVVVDYNLNTVTNAQNQVVEVIGRFTTRASGASYNNGFGFQLDNIAGNKISSVTGSNISDGSYVSLASNGLENRQTYANCIVFDDFFRIMPRVGSNGVNTVKGTSFSAPQTITMTIKFINNGVAPAGGTLQLTDLPISVYNFYIISNRNREVEVHLPDRTPTSLANRSLLGTGDDDSAGSSRFYKTQNNLPWGINIVQGFDYPVERCPLDDAYLHLIRWAETSGAEFPNWYENAEGFRNSEKVY